jgi:predicted O-methyltransferase YrrM
MSTTFDRYSADHNDHGTDKNTLHSYGEVYESLFQILKETRRQEGGNVRALMEIGVYSGASVVAMAETFPTATVYGLDITMERVRFGHERVQFIQSDATLPSALEKLPGVPLDFIIDDGSHCPEDMVAAFVLWAERVERGGFYVIEDKTADALAQIKPILGALAKKQGFSMEVLDRRRLKGRFDDILIVCRKL